MQTKEFSLEVGGKPLTATFSDLADQANGSVIVKYGETAVLVTAVMSSREAEGMSYFPLTVDYEEKFYAAGKILGGRFIKREGRPSDEAILTGRIIDRTIRPLFDSRMRRQIQVVATVLSIDEENDPDILGVIGASLALGTSNIPWAGPVSAIKLGQSKESEVLVNPPYENGDGEERELDVLVCGKDGQINMIESQGKEASEEAVAGLLEKAIEEIEKIQTWQNKIISEIGKEKEEVAIAQVLPEGKELFEKEYKEKIVTALFDGGDKKAFGDTKAEWIKAFKESFPDENPDPADQLFEHATDEIVHSQALENGKRPDGRGFDDVRGLFAQAGGISNIVHGTGIFYRGGTHVLSTLTLGGPGDSQLIEGMEVRGKKYFMHHYNFPPFSVGETGRIGGFNRRATGHGALAEKALRATLPDREKFPYTIRLVSESTASNGSTSMASVCASTLALMDGGVPVSRPTAGIAMGLMSDESGANYKVLTDIQGPEDHHGDMDFKVAGTEAGITAVQMDVKVNGIKLEILKEALEKAKTARLKILDEIKKAIPAPRPDISANAPKIIIVKIDKEKIGMLIGPGGKMINSIIEATEAEIDIEDDGTVFISGKNGAAEKAKEMVDDLFHEYQAGEKFEGEVTRLMDFGAFVKIGPHAEGLVHISEIAPFRVAKVTDALKEGDIVPVVVKEVDEKDRINLSIKSADPEFAARKGLKPAPPAPAGHGHGHSHDRPSRGGRMGYKGGHSSR